MVAGEGRDEGPVRVAPIEVRLWLRAVDIAVVERWRIDDDESRRGDEVLRRLAKMAVEAVSNPGPAVGKPWERIGRSEAGWRGKWEPRYQRLVTILREWERMGLCTSA